MTSEAPTVPNNHFLNISNPAMWLYFDGSIITDLFVGLITFSVVHAKLRAFFL
jgi:hypothetical protein